MLDHDWIAAHIPHQGKMCLLDRVIEWDAQHIRCAAGSHRAADNPLRAFGRLGAANGIEYAAQAMAVHGVLLAQQAEAPGTGPQAGFLVSARGVQLQVARLDDIADELLIEATCVMRSSGNMLYEFTITAAQAVLLHGRAAVVLDADTTLKGLS